MSCVEKKLSSDEINDSAQSNLSGKEWKALGGFAPDRSAVIKSADKGFSVVVWDRNDYLHEASRELCVTNDVAKFNENIFSNKTFRGLCSRRLISGKDILHLYRYSFKKTTNIGKLYFLPKLHKRLHAVSSRSVLSNFPTLKENLSENSDYFLKLIIQESWFYLKKFQMELS